MISGNTTISVAFIISVTSILITVLNYRRGIKKDAQEYDLKLKKEIEEKVKMNVKLDQLCNTTNDIRADNKSVLERLNIMDARLVKVEQSTKSAHHRLDEHIKKECEETE